MSRDTEAIPTVMFEDMRWLPPIASVDLLPSEAVRPGHVVFVIGEKAVYEYRDDGEWHKTDTVS